MYLRRVPQTCTSDMYLLDMHLPQPRYQTLPPPRYQTLPPGAHSSNLQNSSTTPTTSTTSPLPSSTLTTPSRSTPHTPPPATSYSTFAPLRSPCRSPRPASAATTATTPPHSTPSRCSARLSPTPHSPPRRHSALSASCSSAARLGCGRYCISSSGAFWAPAVPCATSAGKSGWPVSSASMASSWAWAARSAAAAVRSFATRRVVGAVGRVARRMSLPFWEVRRRWTVSVVWVVVGERVTGRVESGAMRVKSVGALALRSVLTAFWRAGSSRAGSGGRGMRAAQKTAAGVGMVSGICDCFAGGGGVVMLRRQCGLCVDGRMAGLL
ncbi:hypothetical protein DFP73DRAFT_611704 [Morchella snyderi]|nr:hypothetical protein DFP73DRAFT_611704 [Morchella snyderi]